MVDIGFNFSIGSCIRHRIHLQTIHHLHILVRIVLWLTTLRSIVSAAELDYFHIATSHSQKVTIGLGTGHIVLTILEHLNTCHCVPNRITFALRRLTKVYFVLHHDDGSWSLYVRWLLKIALKVDHS